MAFAGIAPKPRDAVMALPSQHPNPGAREPLSTHLIGVVRAGVVLLRPYACRSRQPDRDPRKHCQHRADCPCRVRPAALLRDVLRADA